MGCRFVQATQTQHHAFYITKGAAAPTKAVGSKTNGDYQKVELTNAGTLVYSDYDGIQKDFDNFLIVPVSFGTYGPNHFRYLTISHITQSDAGTYHCSVYEYNAAVAAAVPVVAPVEDPVAAEVKPETRVARDVRSGRSRRAFTFTDVSVDGAVATSGGITLTIRGVLGQPGAAASARQHESTKFLTYSAIMLSANKLLL